MFVVWYKYLDVTSFESHLVHMVPIGGIKYADAILIRFINCDDNYVTTVSGDDSVTKWNARDHAEWIFETEQQCAVWNDDE